MKVPVNLALSTLHETMLAFIHWTGNSDTIQKLSQVKRAGELVTLITDTSEKELQLYLNLKCLQFSNPDNWSSFLRDLNFICQAHSTSPALILGTTMEIMEHLNWQTKFKLREFLTLYIDEGAEYVHFKLAIAGTELGYLDHTKSHIIEDAQLKAKTKSKLQ